MAKSATDKLRAFQKKNALSNEQMLGLVSYLKSGRDYSEPLVDPVEFILSPYYMDATRDTDGSAYIYPAVLESVQELNTGPYTEAVFTGSIGSGKTTAALYTQAYQLYKLLCYRDPHQVFDLDPASEILVVFQSLNKDLAADVDYERFKAMITASPWFSRRNDFNRSITSEMQFRNRITVKPIKGEESGAIGQNVIGGIIDEINFMEIVEKSKRSKDAAVYDQAVALYNTISRRRKSRFMMHGDLAGMLCMVSSRRYPGEFTELKIAEAGKEGSSIYVYDKRTWDIKPDSYCGARFAVFVGDTTRKPRILEEGEEIDPKDRDLIVSVPVEHLDDFERDILAAIRDVAGISTLAVHPYITDQDAIVDMFSLPQGVTNLTRCDFGSQTLEIFPARWDVSAQHPRFAHIDLAKTGDSAGIAIGHIPEFVMVNRGGLKTKHGELLPMIVFDLILEVPPPKGGEINFGKIRDILYRLKEYGMNIKWVSADTYQSVDTLQILQGQGFIVGNQSMDRTAFPYDVAKAAVLDRRVKAPEHERALMEWVRLMRDPKTDKIDHPPNGSKDISDSMAGVIYGLSMRGEIWMDHGIDLQRVPTELVAAASAQGNKGVEGERATV